MKAYWTEVSNFSSCRGLKLLGFFIPHMWVCESYICLQYVLFRDLFLQLCHCHNLVTHSCFCLQVVSLLPVFFFSKVDSKIFMLKTCAKSWERSWLFLAQSSDALLLHSASRASLVNVRHILMVGGGLNKPVGLNSTKALVLNLNINVFFSFRLIFWWLLHSPTCAHGVSKDCFILPPNTTFLWRVGLLG